MANIISYTTNTEVIPILAHKTRGDTMTEAITIQANKRPNSASSLATSVHYSYEVMSNSVAVWAKSTTNSDTPRTLDLLRDKTRQVMSFFELTRMHPAEVTPVEVQEWIGFLEEEGLSSATIYSYVSKLSSFYKWAGSDGRLGQAINVNPVTLARPKAPKAYNNIQALTPEEVTALLDVIPRDTHTSRRDYAMLIWHLYTGHRRSEVASLTWGDLKYNGALQVTFLVKGGDYRSEEVSHTCWDVLVHYLTEAGRYDDMTPDSPLWIGHGYNSDGVSPLSSHALVKNFKKYCRQAGLGDIHLHQLRHTAAAWIADDTGDLTKVQTFLGHKNIQTTRVYVRSVAVKKDTHSDGIARRLGM